MNAFKKFSVEFRHELTKAIRLSVFLTSLVLGFLVFQNRTVTQSEIEEVAANSPESRRKCALDSSGNRVPASENTDASSRIECKK